MVAQSVECLTSGQEVVGSVPVPTGCVGVSIM